MSHGKLRYISFNYHIILSYYFIAGNSNPAVVQLAAQAHVIFNHKIVFLSKLLKKVYHLK